MKVTTLKEAASFSRKVIKNGKTVGLVVGSFDILHLGHINLFRFAKRCVDYLIVGLDNDQTIKLVKGKNRPVNNFKRRADLLSELTSIDKIFLIEKVSHHDSEEALESYREIVGKIHPTHIFTHKICDKHWTRKKKVAKENGAVFLLDKSGKITHSGTILKKLSYEL
jgi:cytidyltransferase-like protein